MMIHLRTHSYFSFLQGLTSPTALASQAAALNMPALGLADYPGLSGTIEFYEACQKVGVKPILGLEVHISPPSTGSALASTVPSELVLLAENLSGWQSLCRIASQVGSHPDGPRPLDFATLAENNAGLLCLSGGSSGLVTWLAHQGQIEAAFTWLETLKEIFPHRTYVEIQNHTPENSAHAALLSRLAARTRLTLVATHPVRYLAPEQAELFRVMTAIYHNRPLAELPDDLHLPPEAHFLSSIEADRRFSDLPGGPAALAATFEVAQRCQLELPLGQRHYPLYQSPAGDGGQDFSPFALLKQKAEEGARRYYGEINPIVHARLDSELETIEKMGYTSLFLIMEEILSFARQQGVPTSSRGSAACSLVAHCLGITTPDPIGLNLYFERFLNPARSTPPDIDTDLCSRRRSSVINHVYAHYGAQRVAMVATINRFRRRSALREIAKAHALPPPEIEALISALPHHHEGYGHPATASAEDPFAAVEGICSSPLQRQIVTEARQLIGLPRHLSIHAGGVVIAPGPLTDLVPTQIAVKGVSITQFDLESVERFGLLKIDLLGIRGLTVLGDVAESLQATQPQPAGSSLDVLEAIPTKDEYTAELVRNGRTIGCFQIESPGMRATLKEIQAGDIEDVMLALALYRPGPLSGGLKDAFVRRHRGLEPVVQLHPALTPLLADTQGVILYQEQVLRIAHELAGLSLADADLLRRAMSHFDPGKQMQTLKEKFIAGAGMKNQVPENIAERIWEQMAAFSGYGFPKAHAASYAVAAWRAAWCKVYYPAEFMTAVLANWGGFYSQRVYLTEARRLGLNLRPPHVNHALPEFSLSYLGGKPVLFMGLNQVRDLTQRTQARLLRLRPFYSIDDFLARVDPRPVEAENLARCGSLEGFGSPSQLLSRVRRAGWQGGQLLLFPLADADQETWTQAQQIEAEERVLGVSISTHPLERFARQIEASRALTTIEAALRLGQSVRVAGMRQSWRRTRTQDGLAYRMAFEDLEGMLDIYITARIYSRYRKVLTGPGPFLVEGEVDLDHSNEPYIRASRIAKFD